MPQPPTLSSFRRIVVKVGSSLLVDSAAGGLKREWLEGLAADIAALHKEKRDVLVVSSGAIALGRAVLSLPRGALKLEEAQAAAAVGQIAPTRPQPPHHRRPPSAVAARQHPARELAARIHDRSAGFAERSRPAH